MHPEHSAIGELAYRLWQAHGCPEGTAEKDWLDAEKQLRSAQHASDARTAPAAADIASRVDTSRVEVSRTDAPRTDASRPDASRADASRSPVRPRRSKSNPGKPSADPPS